MFCKGRLTRNTVEFIEIVTSSLYGQAISFLLDVPMEQDDPAADSTELFRMFSAMKNAWMRQ